MNYRCAKCLSPVVQFAGLYVHMENDHTARWYAHEYFSPRDPDVATLARTEYCGHLPTTYRISPHTGLAFYVDTSSLC